MWIFTIRWLNHSKTGSHAILNKLPIVMDYLSPQKFQLLYRILAVLQLVYHIQINWVQKVLANKQRHCLKIGAIINLNNSPKQISILSYLIKPILSYHLVLAQSHIRQLLSSNQPIASAMFLTRQSNRENQQDHKLWNLAKIPPLSTIRSK